MAILGKKDAEVQDQSDDMDFLCIPKGTRLAAAPDGKLKLAFTGDMNLGEELPELTELACGSHLHISPGVTIRADSVKVQGQLDLEESATLVTKELEVDHLITKKGAKLHARTVNTGRVELRSTNVIADRVTARESVFIDRGTMEIGTIVAQTLHVTKETKANILIAEVAKLDGFIPKGGYDNFGELLKKIYKYYPEILNDRFNTEARRLGGEASAKTNAEPETAVDPAVRMSQHAEQLRRAYGTDMPKEIGDLVTRLDGQKTDDVRRDLSGIYQKVASQGKMPEPVMAVFRDIQKTLRDTPKREPAAS